MTKSGKELFQIEEEEEEKTENIEQEEKKTRKEYRMYNACSRTREKNAKIVELYRCLRNV